MRLTPKVVLFFLSTLVLLNFTSSQLFFSTTDLRIAASKDISNVPNFFVNIRNMINHLEKSKSFFPDTSDPLDFIIHTKKIVKNNTKVSITHTELQEDTKLSPLKKVVNSMILECRQSINVCTDHLENRLTKSKEKYLQVINSKKLNRTKRGIPFLGELIATITDLPSPEAWGHQTQLVKDLIALANNQNTTMQKFESTIDDQIETIRTIKTSLSDLTIFNEELAELNQYSTSIILDNMKINRFCKQANEYTDILEFHVINKLTTMKINAIDFRPDPWMFPQSNLEKAITIFHNNNHKQLVDPFTHNTHQIYNLNTAITTIESSNIHSILSIPTIDFTFSYDFIQHPNLSKKDTNILQHLSTLALKQLDTFACIEKSNYFITISSRDMIKCKNWKIKDLFICHQRTIRMQNNGENCNTFDFSNSLAIELKPTLILIKTNSLTLKIKCKNSTKTIKNPPQYLKLSVPTHCTIEGEDIFVDRYYPNSIETLEPEEIKLLSLPSLPNVTPIEIITNKANNLENLTNKQKQLEEDMFDIHTYQQKNNKLLEKVNTDNSKSTDPSFGHLAPYAFYGLIAFIIIAFFMCLGACHFKFKSYFCCKKWFGKKKGELETEIKEVKVTETPNPAHTHKTSCVRTNPLFPANKRKRSQYFSNIKICECPTNSCYCADLD